MGGPIRYVDEKTPVETTIRCIQQRYLLRPSPKLSRRINGAAAYAAAKYNVKVHSIDAMSNHLSAIACYPSAQAMADFHRLLNRKVSVEVGHLYGWTGPMWEGRYHAIPIADEVSQIERLRYAFSNSVKENLVAMIDQWPGVHRATNLCDGTSLPGEFVDGVALDAAKRRNPGVVLDEDDFTVPMNLDLHPMPCLAHRPFGERASVMRRLVKEVEHDAEEARRRDGKSVLGVQRILAMDPTYRPQKAAKSPMPLVHASTRAVRKAWRAAYIAFVEAYRRAVDALRNHRDDCEFPEGCIVPLTLACDAPAPAT